MFKIILIIIKDHSITGEKYPFVLNVEELTPSIKTTISKGKFLTNLNPPSKHNIFILPYRTISYVINYKIVIYGNLTYFFDFGAFIFLKLMGIG